MEQWHLACQLKSSAKLLEVVENESRFEARDCDYWAECPSFDSLLGQCPHFDRQPGLTLQKVA
jgi:hypothetical protein